MARLKINDLREDVKVSLNEMKAIFGGPQPLVPPDPDMPKPDSYAHYSPKIAQGEISNFNRNLNTFRRESLPIIIRT